VAAGVTVNFSNKLTGEISLGWGQQNSIEESFSPIEGPLLNADLIWLPTPLTKVEFIARSEIDETTLVDSFGAIDRFYELSPSTPISSQLMKRAISSRTKCASG
jgi:hypothetical protein